MPENDLDNRKLKSIDVASTYVQVLIGLSSGIITATLGLSIFTVNSILTLYIITGALACFGVSIVGGLFGLGALVTEITINNNPTSARRVNIPVFCQLTLFAIGIFLLLISIFYNIAITLSR